ncbi:MAG: PQQ-binding-like beta-propeller repeat protein [Pirellulales bacterium]
MPLIGVSAAPPFTFNGRLVLCVIAVSAFAFAIASDCCRAAEAWPQLQFDARRSGNAEDRQLADKPLSLIAARPLGDAVFTAPVVADNRVFVVDGSGTAHCFDAATLEPIWKRETSLDKRGRFANVNNVSSPAVAGDYLHFGTMTGAYYVLRVADGSVAAKIELGVGDPIFSSPAISDDGQTVYIASLGSRVYALKPNGDIRWTWDFVREVLKFDGDRWDGEAWAAHKNGRVTWQDQFCCSRDLAVVGKTAIVPCGGSIVWLVDDGDRPTLKARYAPKESPATLGMSLGADGAVYRQWYRRDNGGSIEVLRIAGEKIERTVVAGTESNYDSQSSMGFSAVALRGEDVFRTRPEEGFGLVRHRAGAEPQRLGAFPSIAPPIVVGHHVLSCCLDGKLHVVSLAGEGALRAGVEQSWSFRTAFDKPLTAPPAVCDGRVYFGGEDGYLYALGPDGHGELPSEDLALDRVRSPLSGKFTDERYNWFTNFADLANTNRIAEQDLRPPFKLRWIRRIEGTIKHLSAHGGGRSFTHTAEGQLFAVEQETGRLLWRRYYPGVHVSYTAPIYHDGRVLVAQAGFEKSRVRCFDAATGKLQWEAPFSGSPSWNRQLPPLVHEGRVYYCFSTGRYTGKDWLFEHQATRGFPDSHKPLVKCWDLATGKEIWSLDFSEHGAGGDDAGLCMLDGKLFYSCYFGNNNPPGVTAAIEPATGKVLWKNLEYAVHGGCTISAKDGRLYLGGYNAVGGKDNHIYCLDASDGKLIWQSDPLGWAIHVVTLADTFAFTHAQYRQGTLLDLAAGKQICNLTQGYNCTRFTMAGRYLLGANMDIYDTADNNRLIATGPAVDVLLCVGAHVSNGRIFFTTNGGGLQLSMAYGVEAR